MCILDWLALLSLRRIGIDPHQMEILYITICIHELVFKDAAVFDNGSGRTDVILIACYQYPADTQLLTFRQCRTDHLRRITLPSFAGPDPVSDMPALLQKIVIQIMEDIYGPKKPVPVFIQQEEHRIGNPVLRGFFWFEVFQIVIEIVVIIFKDCPQ